MMVFKRKQIVILSLILMILVAGYLQYSYKKSSVSSDTKDVGKIGDSVYVESGSQVGDEQLISNSSAKDSTSNSSKSKPSSIQTPSDKAKNYFAQAKLDRDSTRSRDLDALKAITEDANADSATKKSAYDQMLKMTSNSEKENKLETLIKQKGFGNVITVFGEDGSLDIIVESPTLTSAQVAQITDIASRQMQVKMTDIRVKNIF